MGKLSGECLRAFTTSFVGGGGPKCLFHSLIQLWILNENSQDCHGAFVGKKLLAY